MSQRREIHLASHCPPRVQQGQYHREHHLHSANMQVVLWGNCRVRGGSNGQNILKFRILFLFYAQSISLFWLPLITGTNFVKPSLCGALMVL